MKKVFVLFLTVFMGLALTACSDSEYVNFYNYDGTLLWSTEYYNGMELIYQGDTPTKPSDEMYDYIFTGWSHELYEVDLYKNFYAEYESNLRTFEVSFYDWDQTLIKKVSVEYGESAINEAPTNLTKKSASNRYNYYFCGWDKDITYVTENISCYAQYTSVYCYEVVYKDDNKIINTEYIEEGCSSIYTVDITKEKDDSHYLVFDCWSEEIVNVRCDMIVYAKFKTVDAYTVTFKNYDGSILSTNKGPSGFDAVYKGATPSRPSTVNGYYTTTYKFSGWDKSLKNVTNSFTTYAQYTSKESYYNANYENALQRIRNNATTYDSETGRYYKGFGVYATSTYTESGFAEYDPSTDVVDLYFGSLASSNGATITIYFDLHKPGSYYCTYKYSTTSGSSAMGIFTIYSSFSSSSSVSFSNFSNSTYNSESSHRELASSLVRTCLNKASNTSWIDTYNLGFTNY